MILSCLEDIMIYEITILYHILSATLLAPEFPCSRLDKGLTQEPDILDMRYQLFPAAATFLVQI